MFTVKKSLGKLKKIPFFGGGGVKGGKYKLNYDLVMTCNHILKYFNVHLVPE